MTEYKLLISSDAEEDINDAVEWYRFVGPGLQDEFVRSLEARLESIRRNPNLYPIVHKNVRRALLRKFPYGIFYFVFDITVVVLACFHTRRDPKDWQKRV